MDQDPIKGMAADFCRMALSTGLCPLADRLPQPSPPDPPPPPAPPTPKPRRIVPAPTRWQDAIGENVIICLECGHAFEVLNNHLRCHGLTAKKYRKKHKMPRLTPLNCKRISRDMSKRAKKRGLGGDMWRDKKCQK